MFPRQPGKHVLGLIRQSSGGTRQRSDHSVPITAFRGRSGPMSVPPAAVLAKSQDGDEGFVDAPLLFWGDAADEIAEPTTVDGSDLFNEHPGDRPE